MSINNKTLKLIQNSHLDKTEMLLNKLLKDADMSQAQFAKEVGKDASTVNRWIKNNRSIAWENAEKIAKVLGCHPVEVYQPSMSVNLYLKVNWDGVATEMPKDEQYKIKIPFEFYNPEVKAVQFDAPGTSTDGFIWLFDLHKKKKIDKNCIGKVCYMTASSEFKKNNNHKLSTSEVIGKSNQFCPLVGLLKPKGDGKLQIVNSYSNKLLNPLCDNLNYNDFEYAAPVKAKYDPDLIKL